MVDFAKLTAPFPADKVSWRVGATTADKTKGMALGYIDARDVMDRLDEVCGPDGWQCRYSHANGKTVCDIGVRVSHSYKVLGPMGNLVDETGYEWIWKADGAGDSDIEAAKGALSDSFKRAAVRWGIGRYLYDVKSPWVSIIASGKSFVIPDHEKEALVELLSGNTGIPKIVAQPKTAVGKFWGGQNYSILPTLPKGLKDEQGDPLWDSPETIAKLSLLMPASIDKAPTRLALTQLQADNLYWLNKYMTPEARAIIMEAFKIRASQFDNLGVKNG